MYMRGLETFVSISKKRYYIDKKYLSLKKLEKQDLNR